MITVLPASATAPTCRAGMPSGLSTCRVLLPEELCLGWLSCTPLSLQAYAGHPRRDGACRQVQHVQQHLLRQ
jgi:hypothetical protein